MKKTDPIQNKSGTAPLVAVAALFILVSAALALLYGGFQRALLSSVDTLSADFIRQANSASTTAEQILQNYSAQIFSLRSVTKLRTYEELSNADMIDGIRALNDFTASSMVVDSIYVYNGKRQYIYSTMTSGALSDTVERFRDRDAVALFAQRTADQRLVPIPRLSEVSSSTTNRHMVSLMIFDTGAGDTPSDNALMLNLRSDWFSQLYFGSGQDDLSFIVDEGGSVMLSSREIDAADYKPVISRMLDTAAAQDAGRFSYRSADGRRMLCFYAKMGRRNWYYLRTVPYEKYLSGLTAMRTAVLALVVAAFALALVVLAVISRRIYYPFHSIRQSLSGLGDDSGSRDPLVQLNQLIQRSADSNRVNTALRMTLRDEMLRSLLLGQAQAGDSLADYGLRIREDAPVTPVLVSSVRTEQMLSMVYPLCPRADGVLMNGQRTVLLLQPGSGEELGEIIRQLLAGNSARWIIVGASIPLKELSDAYQALWEANKLHFLHPDRQVQWIEGSRDAEDDPLAAEQAIERVLSALKSASRENTRKEYDAFIRLLEGKPYRGVIQLLHNLNRSVLKYYYELMPQDEPGYREDRRAFEALLDTLENVAAVNGFFQQRFERIIAKLEEDRRTHRDDIAETVLRNIARRYKDPALSTQTLADEIGLSAAYLGRVFRHSQGMSVADYINTLRLGEAKRILRETDMKVKEVGPMVGLDNVQYFFVLFKGDTGMTPRQYRMSARQENQR